MNDVSADTVEFRAAEFAARLYSGAMTAEDEQRLNDWLGESQENKAEYQAVLEIWHNTEALEARLTKPELKTAPKWGGRWAIAASLLMALGLGLVLSLQWNGETKPSSLQSYATTTGEQLNVTLPDGTVATLNTNTRLLVDFSDDQRRLVLEWGQAFFDVAQDSSRPFTVDTGGRAVTVLGTQFDLLKEGLDLKVSVIEGKVAVHKPGTHWLASSSAQDLLGSEGQVSGDGNKRYHLGAGVEATFQGYFGSDSSIVYTAQLQELDRLPSWRYGILRFDDIPLVKAVKEVNRYVTNKILIEDARVMDLKVSGVFQVNEVESSLDVFEKVLPIEINHYPDRVVITGDRSLNN